MTPQYNEQCIHLHPYYVCLNRWLCQHLLYVFDAAVHTYTTARETLPALHLTSVKHTHKNLQRKHTHEHQQSCKLAFVP
jgi:hypothetical protein